MRPEKRDADALDFLPPDLVRVVFFHMAPIRLYNDERREQHDRGRVQFWRSRRRNFWKRCPVLTSEE
jgi:hypothetical protein